ncbi:MAG: glycosyltransferase [Methyloversatilis sp.]|jgi:glycosyltransferase involved in cell wall biosynthesis|uniref:glycosyltransferase n=1 Tax=Methyloversatilis sp. TaxID=2569862 RepID=UPI0025E822DC|nr:glycosyltransferase [Methyloversatilis sp.]MCR6666275.1 glycosyltransferase [Methyloversatilis sp.]
MNYTTDTPAAHRPLRIALMGSRGIPATYSGFETFYEQLAVRLAARGHAVTVYNRRHHFKTHAPEYKGVRIVTLPSIPSKHLDTLTHSFLSMLHALWSGNDVFYLVIVGNSPLVWLAHLLGKKVILNVDGADFARDKWTGFAKRYLQWTERIAARSADVVIADSTVIERRYRELFGRDTLYIPYGANPQPRGERHYDSDVLARFGLTSGDYILFVSRMTPENRAHVLIEAHRRSGSRRKLVLVGDAPYVDDYKREVQAACAASDNCIMTGYLFGDDYRQISSHCSYYVLPAGIDGTRPVLLDQMAFGNCVVVRDTPANMEVIGDAGLSFSDADDVDSLAAVIRRLDADQTEVETMRGRALARVAELYSWDRITDQYEALFRSMQPGA